MTKTAAATRILATASMLAASAFTARAACYDLLGCSNRDRFAAHFDYLASRTDGPICDFLYQMRNGIYQEHGYCFRTARGRTEVGNEGCSIENIDAVPLSQIERENVATIKRAEGIKNCSR